jgi:hypothetical protein
MWILAKPDITPTGGYARGQIITCPKCAVTFRFWTPSSRYAPTAADGKLLRARLADSCPNGGEYPDNCHPDVLNIHELPPR